MIEASVLTLIEAAQKLKVTPDTLRQQIHAGKLKARKLGPLWVIDEADLAAYVETSYGTHGKPFNPRPGYVDTAHVRRRLLFAPADGRGTDAIWIQYLSEAFVFDLDLTNPKPFRWTGQPFQDLAGWEQPPSTLRRVELWNREQLAVALQAQPYAIDLLPEIDPTFPEPIIKFRDGPVWDSEAVERWQAQHGPGLRWSLPIP
jgi:excisionase family DNA binding protein